MTESCNHTSVGMIVRDYDKILLIERKKFPYGFAPPAGHVDDGEEYDSAAKRELSEEVGIPTDSFKLLTEGRKNNRCRRPGGDWHYWKIYEVRADDQALNRSNSETKQAGWFSTEEIRALMAKTAAYKEGKITEEDWEKSPGIEPVWYDWFQQLKLI